MLRTTKGFTLIELIVVMVLIGLMTALTVPRFRYALLTDNLKTSTRKLAAMAKGLRSEAVREHKAFILHLDLESNRLWIDRAGMSEEERILARENAFSLPTGVRILDVWFKGKGKKVAGETAIRFDKNGYVMHSAIHLGADDGRRFTLVLRPFLRRVKVLEDYVEFEES
jgi:prepilin-type N-terminal cleavage/methylation domain-containing protein